MAQLSVIQALNQGLREEMEADPRVVVLGEDVQQGGVFRATEGLLEAFGPGRVLDTPLAESSIVGVAIGMACNGLLPVAEIQFADFIHPAANQILSEAARLRYRSNGGWGCPIVIRVPYGAGIRGALYHSQSIEAFYAHVPGLKVVAPSTPHDAKGMIRAAIRDPDPVIFLEHKKTYQLIKGEVAEGEYLVPIGPAEVRRHGGDVTVFAFGMMLHESLKVAEGLATEEGIEAEVVELRTLRPLDREAVLAAARKTGKVLIVHEDNRTGGIGAEVAAIIAEEAFEDLDAPIMRLAAPEVPAMPYAAPLEHACLPNADTIAEALRRLAAF